jgi:hypothetical protein
MEEKGGGACGSLHLLSLPEILLCSIEREDLSCTVHPLSSLLSILISIFPSSLPFPILPLPRFNYLVLHPFQLTGKVSLYLSFFVGIDAALEVKCCTIFRDVSATLPLYHRVQTEWQRPLSGVHSIMNEKLAQAGKGGGCTPTPFHSIYHHGQSCRVRVS